MQLSDKKGNRTKCKGLHMYTRKNKKTKGANKGLICHIKPLFQKEIYQSHMHFERKTKSIPNK